MNCNKITGLVTALIVGIFLIFPGSGSADDVVIIANKGVTADSLKGEVVKNIFVGKKTSWDKGGKIHFATLPKGNDVHKEFLKKFVRKTPAQYSRYWKKMIFTGKGKKPKTFHSEQEMVEYVAGTEGAIGYAGFSQVADKLDKLNINILKIQ